MSSTYTVDRLRTKLSQAQVDNDLYYIGDYAEGYYCLAQAPDGVWETFIGERSEKTDLRRYPDEAEACIAFLGLMAWTEWHD